MVEVIEAISNNFCECSVFFLAVCIGIAIILDIVRKITKKSGQED